MIPSHDRPGTGEAARRRLGRYRIEARIAAGAMGTVYRAFDPRRAERVALKLPRPRTGGETDALYAQVFFNEMRMAGLLDHPNVVRVHEAGRVEDTYYVAMELVPGVQTLERYTRPGALLPWTRVASIGRDCALALDHAHGRGVVHRDIKPGNVLLANGETVKVADFGIAALTAPALLDTEPVLPAGSPLYMSPEQLRDEAPSPGSDLFSLGVVLYELLTGVHPFAGRNLAAVLRRILDETPPAVAERRPDLPLWLSDLVDHALVKERVRRLASAAELAAALEPADRPGTVVSGDGRFARLRALEALRDFTETELWEVLHWGHWREHGAGEELLAEGETGVRSYVVVSGAVELRRGGRPIAELVAGDCFGEGAFLAGRPTRLGARTRSPCVVVTLEPHLLEQATEGCRIALQRLFIRSLSGRLG